MQNIKMTLSDSQANYLLPLLDDLNIKYEAENDTQKWCDFITQVERDVAAYKKGKLKCLTKDEFNAHRDEFMPWAERKMIVVFSEILTHN